MAKPKGEYSYNYFKTEGLAAIEDKPIATVIASIMIDTIAVTQVP